MLERPRQERGLSSTVNMLDRFDKVSIGVVVSLLMVSGVVIVRGGQLGVRVVSYARTGTASSGTRLQVTFEEPIDLASVGPRLTIDPDVPGQVIQTQQGIAFVPVQPFQPGRDYSVTLRPGIVSTTGRTLKDAVHWQFHVRAPRIIYLGPMDQPNENLYEIDPAAPGQPVQLTNNALGINSYDVLPDGSKIVYAEQLDGSTSNLYVWDESTRASNVLYKCENARCLDPVWRPDGSMVAFEKIMLTGTVFQPPRIWLFDTATH